MGSIKAEGRQGECQNKMLGQELTWTAVLALDQHTARLMILLGEQEPAATTTESVGRK